jgi:hypothetical protein
MHMYYYWDYFIVPNQHIPDVLIKENDHFGISELGDKNF